MSHIDTPVPSARSERISLRVDQLTNGFLRSAAQLEHKSLSAFMLDAARDHARQVVADHQQTVISAQEFARVLDELDREPEISPALLRLAQTATRAPVEA